MLIGDFMVNLLAFIFPPRCIFCGTLLSPSVNLEVCGSCYEKIPFLSDDASGVFNQTLLNSCCDDIICVCEYSGIIKESLKRFKFYNKASYHRTFARLLADKVKKMTKSRNFDIIVSVPLYKDKERARGYNQARLISKLLSRYTGMKEHSQLLSRVRDTGSQSLIHARDQRYKNIKDAFKVNDIDGVKGKSLIIVDDILTTGFTIGECSRVLKEAGAREIVAAVIASGRKF